MATQRIRRKPVPEATEMALLGPSRDDEAPDSSSIHPQTHLDDASESGRGSKTEEQKLPMWQPSSLSLLAITGFIALFAALLISLELLNWVSTRHHGLATATTHSHYLWTYGPTAILTAAMALWHRLEYRMKQLAPWVEMARQPTNADQSLLLDYLSPFELTTLWRAGRRSQFAVVIVILGKLLFRLLIIFSTGLLVLQTTPVPSNDFPLISTYRFNATGFDPLSVTGGPVFSAIGVENYNLSLPVGTTSTYAVQSIQPSSLDSPFNGTVSGVVDGFYSGLDCEVGTFNFTKWASEIQNLTHDYNVNITITSPSYSARFANFGSWQEDYYPGVSLYRAYTEVPTCTDVRSGAEFDCIGFVVMQFGPMTPPNPNYIVANSSSQLICKPGYSINNYDVSFSYVNSQQTGDLKAIRDPDSTNRTLPPSAWDIYLGMQQSLTMAGIYSDDRFSSFFIQINNRSLSEYMDPLILEGDVKGAYSSLGAQIAKQYWMTPAYDPFHGLVSRLQDRLVIGSLSLRAMEAILIFLLLLTLALCFATTRKAYVSRDPSSIGGLATILARSPDVMNLFKGTGTASISSIRDRLSSNRFSTSVETNGVVSTFAIRTSGTVSKDAEYSGEEVKLGWWRPFPSTIPGHITIILSPLAVLVALEVLLQYSQKHDGLADADADGYLRYTWAYMPALVMVSISICLQLLESATQAFSPYDVLRSGSANAARSLFNCMTSKPTVYVLFLSLRRKHFAVFAATLAAFLAGFLTIIVSGLYTAELVPLKFQVDVQMLDAWNKTGLYPNGDINMDLVYGLIFMSNVSYPAWTYDTFVFPQFKTLPAVSIDSQNNTAPTKGLLNVDLPSLRSAIDCNDVLSVEFNFTRGQLLFDGTTSYQMNLLSWPDCTDTTVYTTNTSSSYLFGTTYQWDQDNSACPEISFLYGVIEDGVPIPENLTYLTCNQYVQEVQVNAWFNITANYTVDTTFGIPTADESTAKLFLNMTVNDFSPSGWINFLNETHKGGNDLDGVFQLLVYGMDSLPIEELANHGSAAVESSLRSLWSKANAQFYTEVLRESPNVSQPTRNGTAIDTARRRLIQNVVSTRILEAFLAAIALCTIMTYVLMPTRTLLRHSPFTIATVASLLAGAEMLEEHVLRPGSEWGADSEASEAKLWAGWMFSLGWFGNEERSAGVGPQRRFGIDVGKAERSAHQ
ncbi:hypothetical protein BP6252_06663 [Coleophoma cylindrospora]|uniref:Uncharacterized protein n=1 Tax=Coleophoma cylindrospora TaxID=1849047 RepID=A0A3D8RNY6_9HELO|nr:hypothetical protein BP6252_06663 [Coleophoma cylindrospora]